MRINKTDLSKIKSAFLQICKAHSLSGRLVLFGSRADDKKKGGDIDLLWLCPPQLLTQTRKAKFDLIAKIQHSIGEQKIDLTILDETHVNTDPFYLSIKNEPQNLIVEV